MAKNATESYGILRSTYPYKESPQELAVFPKADVEVLRTLAEQKMAAADLPVNRERKELWYRHNGLEKTRPMVLIEVQGCYPELFNAGHIKLACVNPLAKSVELKFRTELYEQQVLKDDHVVEPSVNLNWIVRTTNHVEDSEVHIYKPETDGDLGARRWDAPVKDIQKDFHKLKRRTYSVDRDGTMLLKGALDKAIGDIVPVRIRGSFWWTLGMTWSLIDLIGLENMMYLMYDDPEGLHRMMDFLYGDYVAYADWLEREGLLTLNNENDYIGSGGMGYSRELPARTGAASGGAASAAAASGGAARKRDLWALVESQETVGVGPELFEEFVFPYQKKMAEQFGLCYYGCCEPVNSRWHILKRIKNLRSVSVSPWADETKMAEGLGARYVYSRKPNPAMISTSSFDEQAIRMDIRRTLDVADGCLIEFLMKDVLTLNGKPERLARWVQLVREEVERR